jgi:hypothetical protein
MRTFSLAQALLELKETGYDFDVFPIQLTEERLGHRIMTYTPQPIDTKHVVLSNEIAALTERLAENAHDLWSAQRLTQGWKLGPERDDKLKHHPCLIPYADLPESEKVYDRNSAMETLKAIVALGYRIVAPE